MGLPHHNPLDGVTRSSFDSRFVALEWTFHIVDRQWRSDSFWGSDGVQAEGLSSIASPYARHDTAATATSSPFHHSSIQHE